MQCVCVYNCIIVKSIVFEHLNYFFNGWSPNKNTSDCIHIWIGNNLIWSAQAWSAIDDYQVSGDGGPYLPRFGRAPLSEAITTLYIFTFLRKLLNVTRYVAWRRCVQALKRRGVIGRVIVLILPYFLKDDQPKAASKLQWDSLYWHDSSYLFLAWKSLAHQLDYATVLSLAEPPNYVTHFFFSLGNF